MRNPADSLAPDFGGVAELWFDSWEVLLAARSTDRWRASREVQAGFIEGSKAACFVMRELPIVRDSGPGIVEYCVV